MEVFISSSVKKRRTSTMAAKNGATLEAPRKQRKSQKSVQQREFHEETCAIVKFFADEKLPRKHYNIVMRELKKEKYYMRVEFEHDNHKKYVTFVKQIPWNASYPTRFSESINKLIKYTKGTAKIPVSEEHPAVTNLEEEEIKINRDYMEKQAIQYWSMPQLKSAIAATRHVLGHRCNRPEMLRESFVSRLASIMEKFPIDMCNELRMCGHFDKYLLHAPITKECFSHIRQNTAPKKAKNQTLPQIPLRNKSMSSVVVNIAHKGTSMQR